MSSHASRADLRPAVVSSDLLGRREGEHGNPAPVGRWTKLLGFTIGFGAAVAAYVLVVPPFAAWQAPVTTGLIHPASASLEVANSALPTVDPTSPGPANTKTSAVRE